jgi:hypothetical protein
METLLCKKFCSFYKPGKEETKCGSYEFLERNLTRRELKHFSGRFSARCDLSEDKSIKDMVCARCGFLEEDCDFRKGMDSPPCGGYTVVEHLLKGV